MFRGGFMLARHSAVGQLVRHSGVDCWNPGQRRDMCQFRGHFWWILRLSFAPRRMTGNYHKRNFHNES